jgi:hypothetical protein
MMRTLMKTTIQKKTLTMCLQQATPHRPARLVTVMGRRTTRMTSKPAKLTMRWQVVKVPVLVMSLPMVRERAKRRMAQLWIHNHRQRRRRQHQSALPLRLARVSRTIRSTNQSCGTEPDDG